MINILKSPLSISTFKTRLEEQTIHCYNVQYISDKMENTIVDLVVEKGFTIKPIVGIHLPNGHIDIIYGAEVPLTLVSVLELYDESESFNGRTRRIYNMVSKHRIELFTFEYKAYDLAEQYIEILKA